MVFISINETKTKELIMTFYSFLFALAIAIVLTGIFSYLFRLRGPWGAGWTFFLVLLAGMLAADVWISPVGPSWQGVYLLPPIFTGLLIALILAAATPNRAPLGHASEERELVFVSFASFLFWLMIFAFAMMIVYGIWAN